MIKIRGKKHLIAIDLDGTLLKDDKTISAVSKQVIQQLMEQGHIVVIATGRPHRMSIQYYKELQLNTPLINSNGAYLHHPLRKNWGVFHEPVQRDIALDVIDLSYELNTKNIIAEVQDAVYLDRHDEEMLAYMSDVIDDAFTIGLLRDTLKVDPTLLLIYPDETKIDTFAEELNHMHADIIHHRNWGAPNNIIEIMNKGINKATAIKQVADYYHIPQDRIIAFGDEGNDLEMIDFAQVGVAMDNGNSELKSIADVITESNESDGVALYLQEHFNLTG